MGSRGSGGWLNSMKVKFAQKIINIFVLREKNTRGVMLNLNTKDVVKIPPNPS